MKKQNESLSLEKVNDELNELKKRVRKLEKKYDHINVYDLGSVARERKKQSGTGYVF